MKVVPGTLAFWATPSTLARSLATSLAVALTLFVVTLPLMGIDAWVDFFRALGNAQPFCGYPVPSFACAVAPVVGMSTAKLLGVIVGAGLAVGSVFVSNDYYAFCLVTAGWIAPTTDMHPHSWLVVFVLAFVGASRVAGRWLRGPAARATASPAAGASGWE